jgi:hypothetical protein
MPEISEVFEVRTPPPHNFLSDPLSTLKTIAFKTAEENLPREMKRMQAFLPFIAQTCGVSAEEAKTVTPATLWRPFATTFVGVLSAPLAGLVSTLNPLTMTAEDIEVKVSLYWRCAIGLYMHPLPTLRALISRRNELKAYLPGQDVPEPEQFRICVQLYLPSFAMVAKTRKELAEEEQRSAERKIDKELRRRQREQADASTHSQNLTDKSGSSEVTKSFSSNAGNTISALSFAPTTQIIPQPSPATHRTRSAVLCLFYYTCPYSLGT